jgi:phospholipid/cholesterol/gamma-HCH transport system permease protein
VSAAEVRFEGPDADTLRVCLGGSWCLGEALPPAEEVGRRLDASGARRVALEGAGIDAWDTGLLTFLVGVVDACRRREVEADGAGLPEGARRLLEMAYAVPERTAPAALAPARPWLARIGGRTLGLLGAGRAQLSFLGEASLALARFARGRASFRPSDLWLLIQDCGASALPIVTLISGLVGLILAFVGAVQLQTFGAQIYVADLVGIGMARQMGAIMTGIIMAGRTGASFAAQLGTMTVNEEIDALRTLGISPVEFLVLPRMLALMLMLPLLCLYADLMGILGGFLVGVGMLDISPLQYFERTAAAVSLTQFGLGLICAAVFGVLVALAGCLRGMQCGRSAQAVGAATTSAVVTGIVWIVVSDGILTVIFNVLGV